MRQLSNTRLNHCRANFHPSGLLSVLLSNKSQATGHQQQSDRINKWYEWYSLHLILFSTTFWQKSRVIKMSSIGELLGCIERMSRLFFPVFAMSVCHAANSASLCKHVNGSRCGLGLTLLGPMEHCVRQGPDPPQREGRGQFWILGPPRISATAESSHLTFCVHIEGWVALTKTMQK